MDFLGVTSVEDMLSENVGETISILRECGIKVTYKLILIDLGPYWR